MDQPKAFVIMPFDVEFTPIYENLIKKPLEDAGFSVARADSFLDQENILGSVIRGITTADLVVADLTTNNPNVFYELGLSHALDKPTVLLAQSINEVPFDLRSYKILIYETHFNKIARLKDRLRQVAKKHINKEIVFRSPLVDFSESSNAPQQSVVSATKLDESSAQTKEIEEKELLDYMADAETATNDLTNILNKLLKDNEVVTNRITRHAANMQALSNNPAAGSASRFRKISLLAASDMNNFSKKVEDVLPFFENTIDRLSENYSGYIQMADPETRDREGLLTFRSTMQSLLQSTREANTSLNSYRNSVLELGQRKISKDLSRASRRQADALNGIITNIQRVEAFSIKTLAMVDDEFAAEL